jgi:hypothetical protein
MKRNKYFTVAVREQVRRSLLKQQWTGIPKKKRHAKKKHS